MGTTAMRQDGGTTSVGVISCRIGEATVMPNYTYSVPTGQFNPDSQGAEVEVWL